MILAFVTGLLMSFIGSMIPTGPIALIVIRRGMAGHKMGALAIVSGAALAESGYALLAYLGIGYALDRYPTQTSILRMIASIILVAFAMTCIFGHKLPKPDRKSGQYAGASFLLGLSIAGLNPTFLVTWVGAVAVARGAGLLSDIHSAPGFVVGVIIGPVLWFWMLLKMLAHHMEDMHPDILRKIEKALPIVLLILAGIMLFQTFYLMANHA